MWLVARLVKLGFRGPVYCTDGTRRLVEIVLPDSGHLHEEEAAYANRKGYSKHDPALPLYTEQDAIESLDQLERVAFESASRYCRASRRRGDEPVTSWVQPRSICT